MNLFQQMKEENVPLTSFTFLSLIKLAKKDSGLADDLLAESKSLGLSSILLYNEVLLSPVM